ncbi:hypothetical protein SAY87_003191 [Trapa incisa]|uniref:SWIRM domain-containing protein n=1 Tax=Trapa incisa TaxID=236973 RepID=A0AAN7QKY4_9MYRT|nr:hypothetical protein SAY87_003191 [Trapa incisa]
MLEGRTGRSSSAGMDSSGRKRSLRRNSRLRNYDENLMDEIIESHLGSASKKRFRTREELEKETETEAMIALSVGFPIDALLDEEIQAGVVKELGGKEQNDYIVIRNHILARWRKNARIWISKGQIKETVSNDYDHLISAAYDFLVYNGYINFGVLPSFMTWNPQETFEGSVVIIGAGLAGLAAARQLLSFGLKVVVLEGRNRPGGRVYTQKMGNVGEFAAVDLGGSVITGIHANPLGVLARQLSIPLHKVREKCPLYKPDGILVDKEIDSRIEFIFNKLLDKVMELRQIEGGFMGNISLGSVLETLRQLYNVANTREEKQLLNWHFANLEYANAGCLSSLSAAYWDQDDPYEMGGDHCFPAGGNWRFVKALCDGVPIFYGKSVDIIRYGYEGVEVISGGQVFRGKFALCTVPLGVLKKRTMKFEPELPRRKLVAIERLGYGLLNKVAMVFPHVFWGEDLDTFACLNEESSRRGEFFLFYSYHTVSGGAVLIALVAGEAAAAFESTNPSTIQHRVLSLLRGIYNLKGIEVPDPIQTICTRWGSDPFSYGSYSHVRVHSSGSDYDIMAENVFNKLFFAGEATSRKYPASMHGAYLSGLREASHIYHAARGLSNSNNNNSTKSMQRMIGTSIDLLRDLFRRPDIALGNLSFVFDPLSADPSSLGIMRVSYRCTKDITSEDLQLYALVTRQFGSEIYQCSEKNMAGLLSMMKKLGVKLMGSNAMGSMANSLIASIANARRSRGRNHSSSTHQNNL